MSNHQTSSGNSTERLPTQEGKYSSSISCHIKKSPSLISRRGWPTLSSSSSSYGSHRSLICCGGSSSHIIVGDSEISTGGMSLRSKSKSMQFYDPTKIKRVSDYCTNRSIIAIHDHGKPAFINDMRVLHSAGTAASTTTAATAELSNKEVSDSLNNIRNTLRVKRSYNCVSPPSPMKQSVYPQTDDYVETTSLSSSHQQESSSSSKTYYKVNEQQFEELSQKQVQALDEKERGMYTSVLRHLTLVGHRFTVRLVAVKGLEDSPPSPPPPRKSSSNTQSRSALKEVGQVEGRYQEDSLHVMKGDRRARGSASEAAAAFKIRIPQHLRVRGQAFNDYYIREERTLFIQPQEISELPEKEDEEDEGEKQEQENIVSEEITAAVEATVDEEVIPHSLAAVEDQEEVKLQGEEEVEQLKEMLKSITIQQSDAVEEVEERQDVRGKQRQKVQGNHQRRNVGQQQHVEPAYDEAKEEEEGRFSRQVNRSMFTSTPTAKSVTKAAAVGVIVDLPPLRCKESTQLLLPLVTARSVVTMQSARSVNKEEEEEEDEGFEEAKDEMVDVQQVIDNMYSSSPQPPPPPRMVKARNSIIRSQSECVELPPPLLLLEDTDRKLKKGQSQKLQSQKTQRERKKVVAVTAAAVVIVTPSKLDDVEILGTGLIDRLLNCGGSSNGNSLLDFDVSDFAKEHPRVEMNQHVSHRSNVDRVLFDKLTQWQREIAETSKDYYGQLDFIVHSIFDRTLSTSTAEKLLQKAQRKKLAFKSRRESEECEKHQASAHIRAWKAKVNQQTGRKRTPPKKNQQGSTSNEQNASAATISSNDSMDEEKEEAVVTAEENLIKEDNEGEEKGEECDEDFGDLNDIQIQRDFSSVSDCSEFDVQ